MLAQPSRDFARVQSLLLQCSFCSRNLLVSLHVSDRSRCGKRHLRNFLSAIIVALRLSDRSRCGPVPILTWHAQPSRHFARVNSLHWFCLSRKFAQRVFQGHVFERACAEILTRDLSQRSCQAVSYTDLVQRS